MSRDPVTHIDGDRHASVPVIPAALLCQSVLRFCLGATVDLCSHPVTVFSFLNLTTSARLSLNGSVLAVASPALPGGQRALLQSLPVLCVLAGRGALNW